MNSLRSGVVAQSCIARAGRLVRFAIGCDALPELPFPVVDQPCWRADPSLELRRQQNGFELLLQGDVLLRGSATLAPWRLILETGEARIYGFGAATGAPDRNGSRFRVMTRDTLMYGIAGASYTAFPLFIARSGAQACGVLVATTYPLDVIVADGRVEISAACDMDDAPVDVILFHGPVAQIVHDLSALCGRTFLPPAWALGFHQSRWSYRTEAEVLEIARRFRSLDLPADVIHLDIHYMDRYRVFTFDPRRFPHPRGMHARLQELGFRTLAIIDPGVSAVPYADYEKLRVGDMLLTHGDGRLYVGKVWPGDTVFPDFSEERVRTTWGDLHRPLVEVGVGGFWNDMNDPVLRVAEDYDPLAEDVTQHGVPHRRLRNLYANAMADATFNGLARLREGHRPFVLSRSGFPGIQRHAAVWTGDNHSSWAHLRENLHMVVNLGLSGVPIAGADVGGFGRGPGVLGAVKPFRPSAELFVRWMELGALMPFFRVHCTKYAPRQEPWSFGPTALGLCRRILRRRYRLLPLLYRLVFESHATGMPVVRPLWMHHDVPGDVADDQFLFGDQLLVAPVLERGAVGRRVWLPPGVWTDWHDGVTHAGDRLIEVDAPLGRTPMFLRAGAAVFTAQPGRNAEETLRGPLAVQLTVPEAGEAGSGQLLLDDGISTDGRHFGVDVRMAGDAGHLRIAVTRTDLGFRPAQQEFEMRLPTEFRSLTGNGKKYVLRERPVADEDRAATLRAVTLPMAAGEFVAE